MGFVLEHNCLLVVPDTMLSGVDRTVGAMFTISKEGERLYPLFVAIEFCDKNYTYIGKVVIRRLTLERGKTTLEGEVVMLFTPEESQVFSRAFIAPKAAQ